MHSLVDVGDAVLDRAVIVDPTAVGTTALFAVRLDVVVAELADLDPEQKIQSQNEDIGDFQGEEAGERLEEGHASRRQQLCFAHT